jgi:hypothetical protein
MTVTDLLMRLPQIKGTVVLWELVSAIWLELMNVSETEQQAQDALFGMAGTVIQPYPLKIALLMSLT